MDEGTDSGDAAGGPDGVSVVRTRAAPDATRAPRGPLEWAAAEFERVQAARVATGEQLRAVLQGRALGWTVAADVASADAAADAAAGGTPADVDALLRAIRRGPGVGPVPLLGAAYQRYAREERELRAAFATLLEAHPAWGWLRQVRGIGPTLAARLLARLRIERAPTPSAFWRYCGLGTDPGARFECSRCGRVVVRAARSADRRGGPSAPAPHRTPEDAPCTGTWLPAPSGVDAPSSSTAPVTAGLPAGRGGATRVAQPRLRRGEKSTYNPAAKAICYLIGVSLMRQGSTYKAYYRERRAGLEVTRPEWTAARRHLGALRATEKLLLAHLWTVWREALGLPLLGPYTRSGHPPRRVLEAWGMVADS